MNVRRLLKGLGLFAGLAALSAGISAASWPDDRPSADRPLCEVAREWVISREGNLPTTLAQFERYPMTYRKAIYNELSLEVRAQLWQAHIAHILDTKAGLSSGQESLLRSAASQLPEILKADDATMSSWDINIAEHFSRSDAREIFGTLGAMNATGELESLRAEGIQVDAESAFEAAGSLANATCECSASGTNYCWFTYCNYNGACEPAPSGCGNWWGQACDGKCGGERPVQ